MHEKEEGIRDERRKGQGGREGRRDRGREGGMREGQGDEGVVANACDIGGLPVPRDRLRSPHVDSRLSFILPLIPPFTPPTNTQQHKEAHKTSL